MLPPKGTSHRQYRHPSKKGRVTIAGHPSDEVDPGTLISILTQAGLRKSNRPMDIRYAVIYAKTRTGYSAHIPDLTGCIATGKTLEQTKRRMAEAVDLHIRGMHEDGDAIPGPTTIVDNVDVDAA